MITLDVESIEAHLASSLQALTTATTLPKPVILITRKLLDYDEVAGQRPAVILQTTSLRSELVGLSGVTETRLEGRVVFYFDLDTGPMAPVTWANAYLQAARLALLADRSRGAHPTVITTTVMEAPTALLWKLGQAFEATLLYEVWMRHEDWS